MLRAAYLTCELVLLFVGVPVAMQARAIPRIPILVLLVASAGCTAALLNDAGFDRRVLWNADGAIAYAPSMLEAFALLAAVLVGAMAWRRRDLLFDLVRTRPRLWVLIMIFYPLLSVVPQEIVYRVFFFHRYGELFSNDFARIVASAALFAVGHVFFPRPWVAMSLTFVGGILFAYHYAVSRSLLLASVEHALFGQLMFTVGLGRFFYSGGAERRARFAVGAATTKAAPRLE
jgi:membrane protease YdiL (CAAX protease family)